MARIFQRGGIWWIDYRTGKGRRVRKRASSDKAVAQQVLAEAVRAEARLAGGLIGADPRETRRPFVEHVEEYAGQLRREGRDERYVKQVEARLLRFSGEYRWKSLADISAKSVERILADLSNAKRTPKTINEARACVFSFCRWAVQSARMEGNPVAHVKPTRDAREKTRRALSVVEVRALVAKAPSDRALIYMTLALTGLRAGEAKALRWGHLHLDAANPWVELPASITKSGKAERVPLVATLAGALLRARGDAEAGAPVFRSIPRPPTFSRDLGTAGIQQIDERGRKAVLHSLRHSLATMLAASSVPMAVAQRIMRHRDIRLTAEVYTDSGLLPMAAAMETLPALIDAEPEAAALRATGTDDASAEKSVPDSVPFEWHGGAKSGLGAGVGRSGRSLKSPKKQDLFGDTRSAAKCVRQESNL